MIAKVFRVFIYVTLFLSFPLLSQAKDLSLIRFDNITQEQGLSNNQVQVVFQDKEGWMWFGTSHGLNRFDGQHFKVYKMSQKGRNNSTGGLIRDIYEDSDRTLWVGVERGGLFYKEYGSENFTMLSIKGLSNVSVNSVKGDAKAGIWVGTDEGLYHIKKIDGKFEATYIDTKSTKFKVTLIKKILVCKNGVVWLGTSQGLYTYNASSKRLKAVKQDNGTFLTDEIWSLYLDKDSNIWIGTYNQGVYHTSGGEVVTKFDLSPSLDRSQTVKSIIQDLDGDFWIGTRAGLYCYNAVKKSFSFYGHVDDDMNSLTQNSILSLFVDAKGDLWVGTRGGISYLIDEKKYFSHYSKSSGLSDNEVYSVWAPSKTEIWIGTESGGINIYDRIKNTFTIISKNNGLISNCIKGIMPDGEGNVWVSTYLGGISIVNVATRRVVRNISASESENGIKDDRVWVTKKDSFGKIWIGTSNGLEYYDSKEKKFISRNDITGQVQVNWIDEDRSKNLWIGTNDNLVIYNPKTGKKVVVDEVVRAFYQLKNNRFLLATQGRGLALYAFGKGIQRYYNEQDGLANNFAFSCTPDGLGGLWVSTTNGLSLFNLADNSFMNYYRVDGLQNNQFNYGAYTKTPQGEMVFGGINGFNVFDPRSVKPNAYIPPVVITRVNVFNEPFYVKEKKSEKILDISTQEEITLKYSQNMISFDFAALNFAKSNKNKYQYMLSGLEEKWVDAGNAATATYSNLAPGVYYFKVRGSNSDGLWNPKERVLKVNILPPFWRTIWFEAIMAILFLVVVYLISRFFIVRENLKNKLVFEKAKAKKLHEIDMLKQQFFTNVSHEIRTPLTLIVGPVEKVLENPMLTNDDRLHLGLVRNNATQLLKLVNQILDFKKLEAGNVKVDYDKGDLVRFLEDIAIPFEFLSKEKGVRFSTKFPSEAAMTWIDADKLAKIVNNLLSNAFKFTQSGGNVTLSLRLINEYIVDDGEPRLFYEIAVSDDGSGIQQSNLNKIFSRFFQDNNSKGITGTGLGLSIVKEFVSLMEGEVDVQSIQGDGTTFFVRLPFLTDADVITEEDGRHENKPKDQDTEMAGASNKYLLVVDDNADIRIFIREHFKHSFTVLEAANGKEGFDMAVKFIPEVVVSDVIMPVMDGKDLCIKLKKDERTSHIPIVLLTASNSKVSEMEGLKAGADDYITKPFDVKILNVKVDNLLQMRNALREKLKTDFLLQPKNVSIASPDERFLRKAVEIVEKYMAEPDLDIELFSSEVGVSRMQLYRKLEALTSMTVKEFIRDIRLRRAAQLIEQDKISVSEVAYAVGFRDLAHFRKCFKEIYGVSPSGYLEKARNGSLDK